MNNKSILQRLAIQSAKNQDWEKATQLNQEIIKIDENDTSALNRLGIALSQLGEKAAAIKYLERSLKIDKSNSIAKKHLERLSKNKKLNAPSFANNHFIEEPGKTKTVELHRLASKNVLNVLTVGTACELIPKNRYISVEANQNYIGALPEDLSFRLSKLIKGGNKYSCYIRSINASSCVIFLREMKRSLKNEYINSFPLARTQLTTINDIDDTFIEDDVPIQIVETDYDEEKTYDRKDLEDKIDK